MRQSPGRNPWEKLPPTTRVHCKTHASGRAGKSRRTFRQGEYTLRMEGRQKNCGGGFPIPSQQMAHSDWAVRNVSRRGVVSYTPFRERCASCGGPRGDHCRGTLSKDWPILGGASRAGAIFCNFPAPMKPIAPESVRCRISDQGREARCPPLFPGPRNNWWGWPGAGRKMAGRGSWAYARHTCCNRSDEKSGGRFAKPPFVVYIGALRGVGPGRTTGNERRFSQAGITRMAGAFGLPDFPFLRCVPIAPPDLRKKGCQPAKCGDA